MRNKPLHRNDHADRGIYNSTYLMILLNNQLASWAKEHKFNSSLTELLFITQIESDNLDDIYLTLVYNDGEEEHTVAAGYVGQKLNAKERTFSEKLPTYTVRDLERTRPYDIILKSKLSKFNDKDGILRECAAALDTLMIESANINNTITAGIGCANGNVILIVKDNDIYVTKIEFYIEEITKFIRQIENNRSSTNRSRIGSLLKTGKV